jgi:RNase H-fold protein (predicted Holliday junction resolvase)
MYTSKKTFTTRPVIIGLDIGHVKTGVAVATAPYTVALPKETVPTRQLIERLKKWPDGILKIVIGDPVLAEQGDEAADRVIKKIDVLLGPLSDIAPTQRINEQFTSREARRHDGADIDASAAALLLQRYLEAHTETCT